MRAQPQQSRSDEGPVIASDGARGAFVVSDELLPGFDQGDASGVGAELERPRDAWVVFLARWDWSWFATFTFRGDTVHPEAADKRFRLWASMVNRELLGPRWGRASKFPHSIRWARALEKTQRDVIHFHALIGGPRVDELRRLSWMDAWHDLAGYSRIEAPKRHLAVVRYCSKYVVKRGEIDMGGSIGVKPGETISMRMGEDERPVRVERRGRFAVPLSRDTARRMELGYVPSERDLEIAYVVGAERARRYDRAPR